MSLTAAERQELRERIDQARRHRIATENRVTRRRMHAKPPVAPRDPTQRFRWAR
jgi:hypothetical protein